MRGAVVAALLIAASAHAQEDTPAPDPELLEFLGEWREGEELVLDDAEALPLPPPQEEKE